MVDEPTQFAAWGGPQPAAVPSVVAGGAAGGSRRRRAALIVSGCLVVGVVVGLIVGVGGGSGGVAATALPPGQLWVDALSDARARGSVHDQESAVHGGRAVSVSEDAGLTVGRQNISITDMGDAQAEVVGSTAYAMGSTQAVLVSFFGFPPSAGAQLVGRWISIPGPSSAYNAVADDATLPSQVSGLTAPKSVTLTTAAPTTVDGQTVIPVSGDFPQNGTLGGPTTMYVTDTSSPLPVKIDSSDGGANVTITLSRWGEPLSLTPPANAIPVSSLSG
jgi:hypothetical protein